MSTNNTIIRKKIKIRLKNDVQDKNPSDRITTTNNGKNILIHNKIKLKNQHPQLNKHKIQLKKKEKDQSKNIIINKRKLIALRNAQRTFAGLVIGNALTKHFDQYNRNLNNYLDDNYLHHLMYLKDSWSEVNHKIKLDSNGLECWWDIELLLMHFAEQLNSSNMGLPTPTWPSNPFNNVHFTKIQISYLYRRIKKLKLQVNYMVQELFNYLMTKLRYVKISKFRGCFITYVSHKYRYKMINSKDSQQNYLGYWVKKDTPYSLFEQRYREYTQMPPAEYDIDLDQVVESDESKLWKDLLDHIPTESVDFGSTAFDIII